MTGWLVACVLAGGSAGIAEAGQLAPGPAPIVAALEEALESVPGEAEALDRIYERRQPAGALTVDLKETVAPAAGLAAPPAPGAAEVPHVAVDIPAAREEVAGFPATYQQFSQRGTAEVFFEKLAWILRLPLRLFHYIHAEIIARGDGSLEEHSQRIEADVRQALVRAGVASWSEPEFVKAFESSLGAAFLPGNSAVPLTDGPESFSRRFELIENARETIHLMSWAIYDDETGFATASKLVEKARSGVKVRVLVDGQVAAYQSGKHRLLDLLESAGVPVVRWQNPDPAHPYDGQHRKVMIVDGRSAIAGGMNIGDHYSHSGRSQKWRDQDILIEGPAAAEADRLFVREWNAQIGALEGRASQEDLARMRRQGFLRLDEPPAAAPVGSQRVAVIDHAPRDNDNGLKSALLAIEAARESIDIEAGYFILTPALQRALERARGRGVRVRVLMNSMESLDVPALLAPMIASANVVLGPGVEVYLRRGSTLHAKFMVADDYAWVGSYNFHPRSDRMERELLCGVLDPGFAGQMREIFQRDVDGADKLSGPAEVPFSLLSWLVERLFYYQL